MALVSFYSLCEMKPSIDLLSDEWQGLWPAIQLHSCSDCQGQLMVSILQKSIGNDKLMGELS